MKQTRQDSEKVQVAVHGCHFASRASADKTTISLDRIYRAIQQASSAEEAQAQQRMQDESPYGPYFHIRTYSLVAFFSIFIFFKNIFTEIYFWFHNLQVYTLAAPLPGSRGIYVIKICVLSHGGPYHPVEGRQPGRPPGRGAAGSPPI